MSTASLPSTGLPVIIRYLAQLMGIFHGKYMVSGELRARTGG
jgi:hypothetical protein